MYEAIILTLTLVYLDENGKVFLFFVIMAANLAFFAYWLSNFLVELRRYLRFRKPRLYQKVFLCDNVERVKREKIVIKHLDNYQEFCSKFDAEMRCKYPKLIIVIVLKKLKSKYTAYRIPPEDKEIRSLLNEMEALHHKYRINKRNKVKAIPFEEKVVRDELRSKHTIFMLLQWNTTAN